MANLTESNTWEAGIYQLEIIDPVEGGPDGIDNLQAKQLGNRTQYLKAQLEALGLSLGDLQPKDATLTALAALITAADTLIYATGADTFATTTLSAFARTLLDDADAAAARATLGAQPLDADLSAIAALVSAADKLPYATGANAWALTTLTTFARTLLDDADAATARATLGLGTVATLTSDTDGTLAANSDTRVASQKAVKTYVDGLIAAQDVQVFKGVINCAANPNYPAADCGHTYRVSAAGKIGGAAGVNVETGDFLICIADGTAAGNHAAVGASWGVIQANLDGALLSTSIGVTVQAYDADLAAIAALVSAADKLPYATGAGAWALATLTAFARSLLDDADAATARGTLGAPSVAEMNAAISAAFASPTATGNIYLNGSVRAGSTAVAALNIDCSLGNYFTKTIAADSTFAFTNVPAGCYSCTLELTHTSGLVSFAAALVWPDNVAPVLSAGKTHLFMFKTDDGGARWQAAALPNYTN